MWGPAQDGPIGPCVPEVPCDCHYRRTFVVIWHPAHCVRKCPTHQPPMRPHSLVEGIDQGTKSVDGSGPWRNLQRQRHGANQLAGELQPWTAHLLRGEPVTAPEHGAMHAIALAACAFLIPGWRTRRPQPLQLFIAGRALGFCRGSRHAPGPDLSTPGAIVPVVGLRKEKSWPAAPERPERPRMGTDKSAGGSATASPPPPWLLVFRRQGRDACTFVTQDPHANTCGLPMCHVIVGR